ncbi:hypothetical protein NUW58_g8601 [Xylaria curta]|uniref:Uncharacterized protein n=1 Tax=Xylaria curta TaxID=42375 RepID=A0ACC1N5U8_9PEZI|nr:hypothetical protein NUW58_g8601 [Xylaria curta]
MDMAARKVAAARAAGCTVVVKSDGLTPFSMNALGKVAERAGLPKGVLNIVTALESTPQLGLAMCQSDMVKKLPGSVAKVEEHVNDAVAKNAKILFGGNRLHHIGKNFLELTVLGDVNSSMKVVSEETFGPLAASIRFKTEDEVVEAVNKSKVGIASYLMTSDLARTHRVSERLEFGMVAVNTSIISDAPAPFRGVKHSGMGREGSKYGIDNYTTIKMVVTGGMNTVYANL